jgi:hypothetical protein
MGCGIGLGLDPILPELMEWKINKIQTYKYLHLLMKSILCDQAVCHFNSKGLHVMPHFVHIQTDIRAVKVSDSLLAASTILRWIERCRHS